MAGPVRQLNRAEMQTALEEIQSRVGGVEGEVTQLQSRVGGAEGEVTELQKGRLLHATWFYVLAGILAAANFAVWGLIGYLVRNLDSFPSAKAWMRPFAPIFGGMCGLALLVFLLVWGLFWKRTPVNPPAGVRRRGRSLRARDRLLEKSLPTLRWLATHLAPGFAIIAVEALAIATILPYLYKDALVKYRDLEWGIAGEIKDSALAPGFALFGNYNDAVSANFSLDYAECTFPSYNADKSTICPGNFDDSWKVWPSSPYGNVTYYTYLNTNQATFSPAPTSTEPLGQQLLLKTNVYWDSVRIGNNMSYNTSSPQNPSLYSIVFDPSMTRDDLEQAMGCGFIGWTEQPALGSNTYTIDEIISTVDNLGLLTSQITDPACKALAVRLYTQDDGYRTYRYHVTSSGTSFGRVCDMNGTANVAAPCTTQILIRVGSFFQTTLTSAHGIEWQQILIDIGGILGAVSFVGWFLTIFQ
nr:hypothetical protein B0A51_01678 [Rachicladosporium sp. CCFEE 5018]